MNLYRQSFALILAAALLTIVSGCAVQHPTQSADAQRTQMTVEQARKALMESIKHTSSKFVHSQEVRISHNQVAYLWGKGEPRQKKVQLKFAGINQLTTRNSWDSTVNVVVNGKESDFYWERSDRHYATLFIEAMLALKEAALAPDTEAEANFAAFTASAKIWLLTSPKPQMPDDVRAYKALAEDAFKRKDFTAALDAYVKALEIYPTWPEGQYNAALLAAESEEYDAAVQHMQRYLVLAAKAKDASAAKDKLLFWQLKGKQ